MRDVTSQPFEALLLLHGGAITGIVYLLLRVIRSRTKATFVTHLTDALFVLIAGTVFAGYLYLSNYGTVRAFLVLSFLAGFALVYLLFSPLFSVFSQKIRKK